MALNIEKAREIQQWQSLSTRLTGLRHNAVRTILSTISMLPARPWKLAKTPATFNGVRTAHGITVVAMISGIGRIRC